MEELKAADLTIQEKLREVRRGIQGWNKGQNGKWEDGIRILEENLRVADESGNIEEANVLQSRLRDKYMELESIMKQKSRIKWLQEGDSNTRFLHSTVKRRRWRNNIHGIESQGEWIS